MRRPRIEQTARPDHARSLARQTRQIPEIQGGGARLHADPRPGLGFLAAHGDLGGRPVNEVIHGTGSWTVRFLMLSLAITPFARILEWPRLLTVRRMVG